MPLQSSGIIVVEKSKTVETNIQQIDGVAAAVTRSSTNVLVTQPLHQQFYQTQPQTTTINTNPATAVASKCGKYIEYYGTTDDVPQIQQQHQHNGCNNSNNLSSNISRSQTQLPLMRRAHQRNSNSSHYISNNKCNSNTATTGVGIVGGGGAATNTKNQQLNVKQQQKQQVQMNKQQQSQHQIIQHNTINHQQQISTQLQQQQSKHQHVQKQQQLSQQIHTQQPQHQQQQLYQQHQVSQQQSQPQHQVIQVSEEFIEQATASGANAATNMMISTTTGEVLNPQIFKIVATDGTTGNMIIDSASATAVGGQSKVLLSNLTVLAKQSPTVSNTSNATTTGLTGGASQQQHAIGLTNNSNGGQQQQTQTINYMNAKNLSYLTTTATGATSIGSTGVGVGSGGVGKTQKYTVTGTYKAGVKQQQHQQFTSASYIHQTQQQTGAQTTTTPQVVQQTQQQQQQQLYQKLSVPRQVQMLTRVQTVVQQQHQQNASVSAIPNAGQQPQQQNTQMLVQPVVGGGGPKYLSSSATTKNVSVTGGSGVGGVGIGIGGNMLKKSTNSLKISHGSGAKTVSTMQMQQQQGVKTTYITQQQQQQQQPQYQLHQPQYQSSSGKIKTSKLLKQYNNVMNSNNNNSTGVNMLQQQTLGTYTISGGGHKLQQTTKLTKVGGSSNKYAMNQQQLQHVANLPQGTHLHHKTMPHQQSQPFSSCNNLVTLATTGNNNSTLTVANNNTIKFVNSAHATVIQQHQASTLPMQQQQTKLTLRHQQHQQQIQFVDAPTTTIVKDNNSGNTIYQQQTQSGSNNTTQSLLNDDIMIVNGTQMTDELSARILQSMAQKSFGNQQRYQQQQQQQTKSIVMPPPTVQQTTQQQQIVLQQHASPTSVLLSPKEYPIYSAGQHMSTTTPTTITTQYTNAMQHQTPVSATAYLPISAGSASYTSSNAIYATISNSTGSASTTIGRQTHSAPGSRTHSLERNKSYEASTTITRKSAVDYYKVNNSTAGGGRGHHHYATHTASSVGLLSASQSNIPLEIQHQHQQQQQASAQIIHLQSFKSSLAATTAAVAAGNSSYSIATNTAATIIGSSTNTACGGSALNICATTAAEDDEIIGEEVRPTPVNTQDLRLRILHAVQQDHTYANAMPAHLQHGSADNMKSGSGVNSQSMSKPSGIGVGGVTNTQSHLQTALSGNAPSSGAVGSSQQWSLGGIGATVGTSGQAGLPTPPSSGQSTYTLHGQQIPRMQQDDDAHSAISNGSRVATGDIDPGEETETAPEAEAEDDSVTRCICDLTHDDGYMICCDKCFAWQHVDCMGIDRQNIPDEYQCEVCQPRAVDKARARSLQLMKRREQTQLLLSAQSAHATGSSGAYLSGANAGSNYQLGDGQQRGGNASNSFMNNDGTIHGLPNSSSYSTTKKGKVLKKTAKDTAGSKKSKKADKLAGNLGGKAGRKETGGAKKTTKRKTKSNDGLSATATAAEKHAANLRQWIENYELAVTNHYSPELRARLHAITKQPSLLQSILNTENRTLKDCCNNGLEIRATTVPHAGGKILISNMDIAPSCPIFELRGKYMLSPQYKTQNASVNMNSPPPSNYLAASLKAHKTPGPFIFFYQLPDAEAPMQTMNQDGSFPSLPPQPAYLKGPEVCVDTRTYGNEARFVRRSCRPNAEIQHIFEKGTIHLFIVATTSIRASTEITIKHEPHDLLAIENKKDTLSNCIVQPTSTACACGLIKDCLFGPPSTHQALGGKSSSRKSSLASTTVNGGVQLNSSAAAMQLTMGGLPTANGSGKKKGGAAQNINRNRSISSSGDSSNGGGAALCGSSVGAMNSPNVTLPAAPPGINAANLSNNTFKSNGGLNMLSAHALAASAVMPSNNGNMSATSSVSSIIHDSGICTSSSSPSVSIPSPSTLHMHSPTQHTQQQLQVQSQVQQAAQQQQSAQQQLLVPTAATTYVQQRANNTLFMQHSPQHQHQQILGSLPTPLLLSPPPQLIPTQTITQTQSQPEVLQQNKPQQQQQRQQQIQEHHLQQPQNVSETLAANNQNPPSLQVTVTPESAPASLIQSETSDQEPLNVSGQKSPRQPQQIQGQQQQLNHQQHCEFVGPPTISDASLAAAAALQCLNTAVTLTSVCSEAGSPNKIINISNNITISGAPKTLNKAKLDVSDTEVLPLQQHQQLQTHQQEQIQFNIPAALQSRQQDIVDGNTHLTNSQQQQSVIGAPQLSPATPTQTNTTPSIPSPSVAAKSPQKHSGHVASGALPHTNARNQKASGGGKSSSSRSTSFSEDDHQQQQHNSSSGSVNDDLTAVSTSTSASASKEKPKLSREDRKMEAILRAIEKMERNQQRKNQQTKSGSAGNTSSSTSKRRNSNMNSPTTPTKRSLGEIGCGRGTNGAAARKKKRKSHKSYSGQSAQARKRRKSRMNSSNESVDSAANSSAGLLPPQNDGGKIVEVTTSTTSIIMETVTNSLLSPANAEALPGSIGSTYQLSQHVHLTAAQNNQLSLEHSQLAALQSNQLPACRHELPTKSSEVTVDSSTPVTYEDQAAGLLLAFANPDIKVASTPQSPQAMTSPGALQQSQYTAQQNYTPDQLKSPTHRTPTNGGANAASPPATPISSACLLIEAAVGPLQDQMDGSSPNGDFKYPNKTKTKKVLMSNWLLNQVDSASAANFDSSPLQKQSLHVPTSPMSLSNSGGGGIEAGGVKSVATTNSSQNPPSNSTQTLSLDSLVQAATMCDYGKQQREGATVPDACKFAPMNDLTASGAPIDAPQNLSMAALKVEEFIQQTERISNAAAAVTYNQTAIGGAGATGVPTRNLLHLPLQVSTCSNNSSVKKRWLRQAISEETTTDDSATATPTTAGTAPAPNCLENASPTTTAHLSAAAAMLNVPNGFTTPLKKRRLIISGDVKDEDELGAGGGGGSSAPSPSSSSANCSYDSPVIGFVKTEFAITDQDCVREAGVKTFKTTQGKEINLIGGIKNSNPNVMTNDPDTSGDEADEDECDEDDDEYEERADVDVVGGVSVNEVDTTTTTIANTSDECMGEEKNVSKREDQSEQIEVARQHCTSVEAYNEDIKSEAMANDQDDDVDILRSPSPGHQQMLAAEDNLVKIEPEDTSGGYDVKIDVEREESLAGDRFEEMVLMQVKKEEEEAEANSEATTVEVTEETKHAVKEEQQTNFKHMLMSGSEPDSKLKEIKKEDHVAIESKPIKAEISTKQVVSSLSSAVATIDEDDAEIKIVPTSSKSPLKLLTFDASSNVSMSDEPLKKRPKLELVTSTPKEKANSTIDTQQTSLLKPLSARKLEIAKQNVFSKHTSNLSTSAKSPILNKPATLAQKAQFQQNCMTFLAAAAAAAIERKPPPPASATIPPTTTTAATKTAMNVQIDSSESNNHSTFPSSQLASELPVMQVDSYDADNATAPLPTTNGNSNTTSASSMLAPRKQNTANTNNSSNNDRKTPLTDDDIQARLHSFHKENILILQTRNNKKSKGNVPTSETQTMGNNSSDLSKNNKSLDHKASSAGASIYTQSHHRHNDASKNVGSSTGSGSSKHSSGTSKTLTNSNSSGATKKLHKKERSNKEHSSSSSNSRSSSTHSGKLSASSSSSSSKKLSSSHKKDYAASTKQSQSGSATSASSSSKQHSSTGYNNSCSATAGGVDSKEREDRRDRERGSDKERHHHRHRTSSSSNSTSSVSNVTSQAVQSTTPPHPTPSLPLTSKKRQLNFEQELTKDLALVNATVSSSSSRHRKDSGSARLDSRDDTMNSSYSSSGGSTSLTAAARKRRESSSSGGGSSRHRHNSSSSSGGVAAEHQKDAAITHKSTFAEYNGSLPTATVGSKPVTPPHAQAHVPLPQLPPPSAYVRTDHAAIPHFNNVVVSGAASPAVMAAYFSGIGAVQGSNMDTGSMVTPIATYVPTPAVALSAVNSATHQPSYSLLKTLPIQPALSHLPSPTVLVPPQQSPMISVCGSSAVAALALPTSTVLNSATNTPMGADMSLLSTYNSIYGKLRDNTPAIVPPPTTTPSILNIPPAASAVVTAPSGAISAAQTAAISANISLSEYLDTKVKSYSSTMGAYVSPTPHSYVSGSSIAGSNATGSVTKPIANNSTPNNSINSANSTDSIPNANATTTLESSIVSKLPTPLKMIPLTRTASHDPRLNPQLNVPEPPPAPKRKLSINEYRKRMQLSSDSTTPGTPDTLATNSSSPTTPASTGANAMTSNTLNNSFAQAYNSIVNASPEEMARKLSSSPTTLTLNKYTLNSPERKRRYSGSEKDHHRNKRLSSSFDDGSGVLNSSTGSSSSGNMSDTCSASNLHMDDDGKKGQFSAAPTLLEKQQEKLCERLKLLRNMNKSVTSLSTVSSEFGNFKKDCDLYLNRTNSISSADNLDNCLEEISSSSSSSSTSCASSRGVSPERSSNSINIIRATNAESETTTTTTTTKTTNALTPNKDETGITRSDNDAAT